MDRRSAACSCSDEDFIAIFSTIMWNDVRFRSLGYRRSARRLSEQDLLSFFRDGGAVRVRLPSRLPPLPPPTLVQPVRPTPPGCGGGPVLPPAPPRHRPGGGSP